MSVLEKNIFTESLDNLKMATYDDREPKKIPFAAV